MALSTRSGRRPSTVPALLTALLALGASPGGAAGQLWIEAGEGTLRRDVEVLAAHGLVEGPVVTWPLPWAQIRRSLASAPSDASLPQDVASALARVRAAMPDPEGPPRAAVELRGSVTDDPRLVRGFDGGAREEGDVSVHAYRRFGASTHLRLGVGWRDDQRSDDIHFDDAYLAHRVGNWAFYGGTVGQWWGGSWDGALVMSTNGRSFPRVGVQRLDPRPFETRFLRWLGSWNLHFSAGRLEDDRAVSHPILFMMRGSIQPVRRLDIGFSRAFQICGEDRGCDLETWAKAITGVGNLDNRGRVEDDASNQLAAIDVRYSGRVASNAYSVYGELMSDDQGKFIFQSVVLLLGATLDGHWGDRNLGWRLRFEAADTESEHAFGAGGSRREFTYQHFVYRDGWTFRGATLGHGLGTDSRLFTGEARVVDGGGRDYWLRYRHAKVNATGGDRHQVSGNREVVNVVEAGLTAPLPFGSIHLEVQLQDDQPNTPGREDGRARVEVGWRVRR